MIMPYTINEHLHRFGIWTAARAAQRSVKYFTIKNLYNVLEEIQFKMSTDKKQSLSMLKQGIGVSKIRQK